jgi:hypothetical protein
MTSPRTRAGLGLTFAALALLILAPVASAQTEEAAEPADAPEAPAGIHVTRVAICTQVEERAPVGEAETFPSDVGHLYCFSEIDRADPPEQIFHRWFVGDRLVNEIPITVRASHWRCWSKKTISAKWTGACRVEVVTEAGDELAVAEFTLE